MAKVITTELQHAGASGANITLDSSKNVTCENNLQVDGNVTVTGTIPADKLTGTAAAINGSNITNLPAANLTGTLPAISGANLTGISSPLSFRNKIINGSFWVWQRGTSGFDTNDTFTADRWRMIESGGTGVVSRQAFTVGSEIAGSEYYLNYNVTTASDYTGLKYRIENIKSIEPGTWTISFWAKHTSAGPNGGLMIRGDQNFGSGGSSGVSLTSPAAITTTTSWVRYSKNITIPSISGKTVGANSYLQLEIGQGANAGTGAWNLDIANVQFEKGSTVTDFEQRGYADELLRCQRYLFKIGGDNQGANASIATGFLDGGSGWSHWTHGGSFPVEMRVEPSLSLGGAANAAHINTTYTSLAKDASSISMNSTGTRTFGFRVQGTSGSNHFESRYAANSRLQNDDTWILFSAEL